MLSGMWSMNIVNSAKPRQKSMPSMRFAGAAMFPRPDFIDRPRLTVIHFDRWLKCDDPRAVAWRVVAKAPWLAAIAAGVGTRRQRHKARNLLIKMTQRERSSSLCAFSPKEP
jgi:hypothetical protein